MTGISSGVATTTAPVVAGSVRMSIIQSVWSRTSPTLHQLVDRLGGGELADHVAGGRGVDHDQVVVALRDLPRELADGEDLLHPGRGVGHEVEASGRAARSGRASGILQLEPQVLLAATPRCPSTWRRGPGATSRRLEPRRARPRRSRPGCPWRRPRTTQRALPPAGGEQRRGRTATVVLPTPPLPVTKSSLRSSRSTADRAAPGCGSLRTRSRCGGPPPALPIST